MYNMYVLKQTYNFETDHFIAGYNLVKLQSSPLVFLCLKQTNTAIKLKFAISAHLIPLSFC